MPFVLPFANSGVRLEKEMGHRQAALLEFLPSNPPGAFRLRGVVSNLYLAMDKKGMLYGEPDYEDENTLFVEHAEVRYVHNLDKTYETIFCFKNIGHEYK